MRRFWLVLFSLGLVFAFSASAFAVDIKTGAEFYVGGLYLKKTVVNNGHDGSPYEAITDPSTAFFFQRLRVGTDFIVSPSLKLVTRFDAMERIWGGARSSGDIPDPMSAGTRFENENIAVDVVYIDYTSPIGQLKAGYMPNLAWGTVFGNDSTGPTVGSINWSAAAGPVILIANYAKIEDNSFSAVSQNSSDWVVRLNGMKTDRDVDSYRAGFIYPFKNAQAKGQTGILMMYDRDASHRGNATSPFPYLTNAYKIMPYAKASIGPVALEAEVNYTWGDALKGEYSYPYQKIDSLSAYVNADAQFGIVKIGGTVAYVQGDDSPYDDAKHDFNTGGIDFNPCLLMFNYDIVNYWIGGIYSGHSGDNVGGPMTNAWFLQGRVGLNPAPKIDLLASLSWAEADKKPQGYAHGDYGWEIDVTGTYKITNNLSYMLGAGYLFTGGYFKGTCIDGVVQDDFIILNKLTLNF